ncbi:MAG: pectate lyase [Bacteroidota bacterium]|nr:pectate lyase [Bacteroidota bacterium]
MNQMAEIADNILLYQKTNTTFDNGATHSQVEYLAKAYSATKIERFKEGCLRGIDFILTAQYPNGGFPQFFPDTSGYRKYITFNDGAMIGVMKVLHKIAQQKPWYSFVDSVRRAKTIQAFDKGVECILQCQIIQDGKLSGWCQQHDNFDFRPQSARTFEPASLGGEESAEIVRFLMSLENPSMEIINAVQATVIWLKESQILGIRVETIEAPIMVYKT